MKKLFIFIIIFFSNNAFSSWYEVKEWKSNVGIVYLDNDKIKVRNENIYIQVLTDKFETGVLNSFIDYWKINCKNLEVTFIKSYYYKGPMGKDYGLTVKRDETYASGVGPEPFTTFLKYECNMAKSK